MVIKTVHLKIIVIIIFFSLSGKKDLYKITGILNLTLDDEKGLAVCKLESSVTMCHWPPSLSHNTGTD